jgi:hypothetical protein
MLGVAAVVLLGLVGVLAFHPDARAWLIGGLIAVGLCLLG